MSAMWSLRFGARLEPSGVEFRVWAPRQRSLHVVPGPDPSKALPMVCNDDGEFAAFAEGIGAGQDYQFLADNRRCLPDPVSRWQPLGVHGPSRVVDPAAFAWTDAHWRGIPLEDYLIYELHTGTFTPEGTFESIIPRLPYLLELGVTAVELMPVAQFPGARNWGYDGVGLYAPQSTYGGPTGLKTLVDACHGAGLAVVLDVVYNHLGPEGNYLEEFAPFFTSAYRTPWGDAINFDGPESDGVRRFFVDNALYWLTEYHIDALRLDAIQGIFDFSAHHILQEVAEAFHTQARLLDRAAYLIAESDLNDARVIQLPSRGGYGVDAQWLDDFHHALHTALTHESRGYFADFEGLPSLRKALTNGYVYDGQRSRVRRRRHGSSSKHRPGKQFVVFSQNHDQVANAFEGMRSANLLSPDQLKLSAAVLLFSPFLPLLFMGQEYGETARFDYFTDHGDPALIQAVREGRSNEIGEFLTGEFIDPQCAATFEHSKLDWGLLSQPHHAALLAWYRDCISTRKHYAALANCSRSLVRAESDMLNRWLAVERSDPSGSRALLLCNFSNLPQMLTVPPREVAWWRCLWSRDARYGPSCAPPAQNVAAGSSAEVELFPFSAALYIA